MVRLGHSWERDKQVAAHRNAERLESNSRRVVAFLAHKALQTSEASPENSLLETRSILSEWSPHAMPTFALHVHLTIKSGEKPSKRNLTA